MKNALICFLKYPMPGHVKTRLASELDKTSAAHLYEALAERVLTEIYPLANSYEILLYVDPTHDMETYSKWIGDSWSFFPQKGADLGERLSHAMSATFALGYEKVAIIGSDCIGMDQDFIEDVFSRLDHDPFVVGPSSDGGYYLIASREDAPWLYENVAWSTDSVLETTLDKIDARNMKNQLLEEKLDVDTLDDLVRFRKELPGEHFLATKIDHLVVEATTLEGDPDDLLKM